MEKQWRLLFFAFFLFVAVEARRLRRVLFDTDVNSDDIFALVYLLKQDTSLVDIKAITVSANSFCNPGHGVNHIYDVLYMMDRDDIIVGVGGEGGVLPNGTIRPNVGGYLPLIEQGTSTAGDCRYRQVINRGENGLLSVDTSYGLRRSFLPQGDRHYSPLHQPTAQEVMFDAVSEGPITVFSSGSLTNLGIFIVTHPELKQNIEHIYVMGGGVRSKTEFGCELKNDNDSCKPSFCGDPGNLFTYSNPYGEFNVFVDPFAAYQVIHSGLPITLIPLDATNTIPISHEFFDAFERYRNTYEAEYCFQMLNIIRDTWFVSDFFNSYYMWDSFAAGVAVSSMRNEHPDDENEFAELEYMNITVVTSNEPYGVYDGSNPFFDGWPAPKFGLQEDGVHSGHVQTGPTDPFCHILGIPKGICQDGYTKEDNQTGVRVLVATKAKPHLRIKSTLDREFYLSFLSALNLPQRSARFNLSTQFPYYREIEYKPDFKGKKLGKPLVFDMDISVGDVLALIYLLKVPVEVIDLKGVLVSGNGWANAATIDIVYDVLHMMGRDDIPVGLGNFTAIGTPSHSCKYVKAVPHGHGGLIDSDTLFGLARSLPRSPRRYTAQTQGKHRQPSAMQVWRSISNSITGENKINMLTNGPLSNLASIILSDKKASSIIESVHIVGGHITDDCSKKGNVFTYPENEYAEFNMFLDPLAAKKVIESDLQVTLIPLTTRSTVTSFSIMLKKLNKTRLKTPESMFTYHLLSRLRSLQKWHQEYNHMDMFLGEIIGAVMMAENEKLNPKTSSKFVNVLVGDMQRDGEIVVVNESHGKLVNVVESVDEDEYYAGFANLLADKKQSAVIASFAEQKKIWSSPPDDSNGGDDKH